MKLDGLHLVSFAVGIGTLWLIQKSTGKMIPVPNR